MATTTRSQTRCCERLPTIQTQPEHVLDTLDMQLTQSINPKFAGMYATRVGFRRDNAARDNTTATAKHSCRASRPTAVRRFMHGSKTETAKMERFLQGGFLLGGRLEQTVTATHCKHAQHTCKDATQEDINFVLHEVFEKWEHTRMQAPVTQLMTATPRLPTHETHTRAMAASSGNTLLVESEFSRRPGRVSVEIFVRTISGKTITVAIGDVLTTNELPAQIGDKVNLFGHGLVLNCAGREIQKDRLLSEYNIQNHAVLQQMWRLHGGMEEEMDDSSRTILMQRGDKVKKGPPPRESQSCCSTKMRRHGLQQDARRSRREPEPEPELQQQGLGEPGTRTMA